MSVSFTPQQKFERELQRLAMSYQGPLDDRLQSFRKSNPDQQIPRTFGTSCNFFLKGYCRNDLSCRYAHGTALKILANSAVKAPFPGNNRAPSIISQPSPAPSSIANSPAMTGAPESPLHSLFQGLTPSPAKGAIRNLPSPPLFVLDDSKQPVSKESGSKPLTLEELKMLDVEDKSSLLQQLVNSTRFPEEFQGKIELVKQAYANCQKPSPDRFFKTKLCKLHVQGRCTRGAECSSAHSLTTFFARAGGAASKDLGYLQLRNRLKFSDQGKKLLAPNPKT